MRLLNRLTIATKLWLLVGLFTAALAVTVTLAATSLHDQMRRERVSKLKAAVDMMHGLAAAMEKKSQTKGITRTEAIDRVRHDLYEMRYDGGVGFGFVYDLAGTIVINPGDPKLEGANRIDLEDTDGIPFVREIIAMARDHGEGLVEYRYPRPGQTEPERKLTYVKRFEPWNMVIASGAYLADLEAEYRAELRRMGLVALALVAAAVGLALVIGRNVSGSIGRLKGEMLRLATGDLAVAIDEVGRRDEVGDMARAVAVFKDGLVEAKALAEAQERDRAAKAARQSAVESAIQDFIGATDGVLSAVNATAGSLRDSAQALSATADQVGQQSGIAAAASDQASAHVQTVASAAEELSSSIGEIGRQVARGATIADGAVAEAGRTNDTIRSLSAAAQRIGEVVNLISDVAGQTNLLALNATIEAARAGEHGKGFAVVASEVKQLAAQTARATGDITAQVEAIQAETRRAAAAIEGIAGTIGEISAITGSVATAVHQQGAATGEIARNVQEAARGSAGVTGSIGEVDQAAAETGQAAVVVLGAADAVVGQADALRREVERFLVRIRAA